MSSSGAGYDQSVFTYSPEGRIFQVEYAQKAVEAGGTAVGVRCRDGVILGVEKLVASKMLLEGSGECSARRPPPAPPSRALARARLASPPARPPSRPPSRRQPLRPGARALP